MKGFRISGYVSFVLTGLAGLEEALTTELVNPAVIRITEREREREREREPYPSSILYKSITFYFIIVI